MNILVYISEVLVPLLFIAIIAHGYLNEINIYEAFIEGAKDGIITVWQIMPTVIGLMVSVGILSGSGALTYAANLLTPLTDVIGFPSEAVPLVFMRLISSSASVGLILDIFKNFGPDSFLGSYVSILMSCTETIFYTMAVYFLSVKITKTRHTLFCALCANFVGVVLSLYAAERMFMNY